MDLSPIISVDDLLIILDQPDLRIIDSRFLLSDKSWGQNAYLHSHIPGAVYAHLDRDLSSTVKQNTGRHPLPKQDDFIDFLQNAGISKESKVVAYDDSSGSLAAARLWWLLRAYGLGNVQVLDGSYSDWTTRGYPTRSGVESYLPGDFIGSLNQAWIVDATEVEAARKNANKILLDARSHDRFLGQNEIIDSVAGHIPGAKNRPITDNLDEHLQLKESNLLAKDFAKILNNTAPENVILYCGSGVTACFNHLAMETAGLYGAKIYPGSWSEWITDPSHEIATGD